MPKYHDLKSSENDAALMDRVLRYLADQEGFVAKPTVDPNLKQYNIGYGSKIDTSKPGWEKMRISQSEAKERLKEDFLRHREYARKALQDAGYKNPSGRVLDGYGLLFFNTNWGKLAEGKRFQEAARTAAAGNEEPLIAYAQGIDKVNGKWNANIAARRTAEGRYMAGENLPVKQLNTRARLQWEKPAAKAEPSATPTPNPLPTGVAASKEGPSIWERLRKHAGEAADFAFGTAYGQKAKERDAFARFREGATKDSPKPTPSTPLAATEKEEPAPALSALEQQLGDRGQAVHDRAEEIKRAGAKLVADAVLDPELMNAISEATQKSGESFESELMKQIWQSQHPDKPVPENITEVDLPVAAAIAPRSETWEEATKEFRKPSFVETRKLLRRVMAERQQPGTAPASSLQQ